IAYSARANPANTPITVNSGKVFTSQSMPAPTPRPVTTPPNSRKATDSAEVDEPFLSSSRLSSDDCKVILYLSSDDCKVILYLSSAVAATPPSPYTPRSPVLPSPGPAAGLLPTPAASGSGSPRP